MELEMQLRTLAREAKDASRILATSSGAARNAALLGLAQLLEAHQAEILGANAQDLDKAQQAGLDSARMERLRMTEAGIAAMCAACRHVAALPDPIGEMEQVTTRPNGLMVGRMRIPLGVIAIIYESRPNVTIDAAILCLKAGNSVILRGGSEAYYSNMALTSLLQKAIADAGLPQAAVQMVPTTSRSAVPILLGMDEYIDVVIPRGGEGLIRAVVRDATMPVLKHYKGVCHIYVHEDANMDQAIDIIKNAKTQRPAVCNALECLLVHQRIAPTLLPVLGKTLGALGVSFRACPQALPLLGDVAEPALPTDWGHEFLSLTLAVRVVGSQSEAEAHIAQYGSGHSEAILTADYRRAMRFLRTVDASCVLVNASTRFNDGGELGLGAEIGISTSKVHAYGPMGVKELTSQKFVVFGDGHVRQ
ncbi:gamma-glutamyl phosphate reductase [Thermodesulfomicrobium sp. WS]|jgi:glutamate-5-semialdehyde dehydrogenase|uniref:glutamate-5-semialdehyde dehydrogenase n=1 Tax=Thermodesulfomicrobium sp. WS TaxID=3004129 RepID=UPI002493BA22|nr:glutamate-5-semialdehyde dehydrogenase [Thermodesulfomicrobium sp. WS]BDV01401.1 gamma-glutamyl phosphate reductase [Thermodesulfomicrobium sp. WS]